MAPALPQTSSILAHIRLLEPEILEKLRLYVHVCTHSYYKQTHLFRAHDDVEGGLKFVAFSFEDADCPEVSGLVRAELIIGGYLLIPVRDESGTIVATEATYCISTDAKGNIPAWILTIKAKEQPQGLTKLNKLIR